MKKNPKILVTGGEGMLANYFKRFSQQKYIYKSRKSLDISNWNSVKTLFDLDITGVIHLAAITDVDWCESNKKKAYLVNTTGTKHIAEVCRKKNLPLIFTSTSAVFNGKAKNPYNEFNKPDPANYYAYTKLEAEKIVRTLDDFAIVRLGWLIGKRKKFLFYILKQIEDDVSEIRAISDIRGTITYAYDCVKFVDLLLLSREQGTFHLASKGSCSRFELAKKIVKESGKKIKVKPVSNKEFSSAFPAPRPLNESILSVRKVYGFVGLGPWEKTLSEIKRIEGLNLNEK